MRAAISDVAAAAVSGTDGGSDQGAPSELKHERQQAALALRVLLGELAPGAASVRWDWHTVASFAGRNAVLVRLADRFTSDHIPLPDFVYDAVERERQRVAHALRMIRMIDQNCSRHGIAHLFPKALQHYPDMGHDVDLLVHTESTAVDRLVLGELSAVGRPRALRDRLAGTTSYRIGDSPLTLDILHGRVGVLGEHRRLATLLVQNRRCAYVAEMALDIPSPELQVVLQGLQKVSGASSLRLADVLSTIAAARGGWLDWNDLARTARQAGVYAPVCCYLAYVNQIHEEHFGQPLLPPSVQRRVWTRGWGRVVFRDGLYRFPHRLVHRRLHATSLASALLSGDWGAAARLCCLHLLAVGPGLRRLVRPEHQW
jgi:hypothetical protein